MEKGSKPFSEEKAKEIMEAEELKERSQSEQDAFEAGQRSLTVENIEDISVERVKEIMKSKCIKKSDLVEVTSKCSDGRIKKTRGYLDLNDIDGRLKTLLLSDRGPFYVGSKNYDTTTNIKCVNIIDIESIVL